MPCHVCHDMPQARGMACVHATTRAMARVPHSTHATATHAKAMHATPATAMHARRHDTCLAPRAQQVLPTPQRFGSPRADHHEFWLTSTASNNSNANR